MGFSLYTLFQAGLLCLNAICVLNEERFLSKIGWSTQHGGFGEDPGMKLQVMSLNGLWNGVKTLFRNFKLLLRSSVRRR